ncbi:MAG: phosphate starvation-inducible protein PsiF [Paucibacter sp.]|nr:phosphate starvation-inducible protein PsiF [Roseateles sp.]
MKSLITVLAAAAFALTAGGVHAKENTAQQNKMASCNKEATGKKGDERKAFMSQCLSAKPAEAASAPADSGAQAACDAKAAEKKLHGAAKTSFTKKCVADAGK